MDQSAEMYIDLMKLVLTDMHRIDKPEYKPLSRSNNSWKQNALSALDRILLTKGYSICKKNVHLMAGRIEGIDHPANAETMIGIKRIENLEHCVVSVLSDDIEGDFIETGVWRGGATIFMQAILRALKAHRTIWVADSFMGLPEPDTGKHPADTGDQHYKNRELAISRDEVKHNFEKYGLYGDNIKFLEGWFKDTLPSAPVDKLSIIRLDGDMYGSTMDAISTLYPKLSTGGYIIIDDYGAIEACRMAVEDYRAERSITDEIQKIDWTGVYWKKNS